MDRTPTSVRMQAVIEQHRELLHVASFLDRRIIELQQFALSTLPTTKEAT